MTERITVAYGDGIGPEIMAATLDILKAVGADLIYDEIKIGEQVYQSGESTGISSESWNVLKQNKIFLKAPITTPQGGGVKSLNVTIRKTMGLYANVRPCVSYHPFIKTHHPVMDVVVVRENEEDLYAGIEHRQTAQVTQALKLISRPGSEKIIRYAFEYARQNGRKKVTCVSKDNIMKISDGLFHQIFDEVAKEYPDIESAHWIVDIGIAKMAVAPEDFDVLVLPNLYGDIMSDVAAEVTGSVGIAGSSNIGTDFAMFEAIHGSAPTIAGQNIANPSGLLLGSVMMLNHIGQCDVATKIHNAWLKTLEDGFHTADIFNESVSVQKCSTQEFSQAVQERLDQSPKTLDAVNYKASKPISITLSEQPKPKKEIVGVDVFLDYDGAPDALGDLVKTISDDQLRLKVITNRGVKVWPDGCDDTFCSDHWRCRFVTVDESEISHQSILSILNQISEKNLDFIKMETLCRFDGKVAYSLAQGE